jgi:hypothetical protein
LRSGSADLAPPVPEIAVQFLKLRLPQVCIFPKCRCGNESFSGSRLTMSIAVRLLLLLIAIAATAGCYSNPAYRREVAVLRGEIIDLENKYYSMKSDYESAIAELDHCRGYKSGSYYSPNDPDIIYENQPYDPSQNAPEGIMPRRSNESVLQNNGEKLPRQSKPKTEEGELNLKIEDNESGGDDGGMGFYDSQPNLNTEPLIGPRNGGSRDSSGASTRKSNPQSWIRNIRFQRELCRAENRDGKPGDDGLLLVLQPVDENGDVIPVAGDMVISVIDPAENGRRQRIGFYRFQANEVEPMLESSEALGAGIHLRLDWNNYVPRNSDVQVFVRYMTRDKRKFESSIPLRIETANGADDQWVNRPAKVPARPASSKQRPQWRPRR